MGLFNERVKARRLALKLSQKQLAKQAGLSQNTISDIERGRNDGSRSLVPLAKALGVTPEYLTAATNESSQGRKAAEFAAEADAVYRQLNEAGRKFLEASLKTARIMYADEGGGKKHQ